jgi:hypothetical protein
MQDADSDGLVSVDEFKGTPERFVGMDANGDGMVSREEMTASRQQAPAQAVDPTPGTVIERVMRRADKNGDGALSREEFAGRDELFADADANADGVLSAEELGAYVKDNPRRAGALGGDGPRGPGGATAPERRRGQAGPGKAPASQAE